MSYLTSCKSLSKISMSYLVSYKLLSEISVSYLASYKLQWEIYVSYLVSFEKSVPLVTTTHSFAFASSQSLLIGRISPKVPCTVDRQ